MITDKLRDATQKALAALVLIGRAPDTVDHYRIAFLHISRIAARFLSTEIDAEEFLKRYSLARTAYLNATLAPRYLQQRHERELNLLLLAVQNPDAESVAEYVTKNGQAIIDFFTRAEMNRQIQVLEYQHSDMISKSVKEMFDCDVWVSGELKSSKRGEDFFWAGANAASGDQNYVIYSYPYNDRRTFTQDFFIQKRDSVMKVNIPGAAEGTYMATDARFVTTRAFKLNGEYIFEARGLWKVKGDMMGGPFVSQSRVDTVNQRVITEEIFIYAPEKMKRNLVRGMEAALYTIKLPGKAVTDPQIPLQDD